MLGPAVRVPAPAGADHPALGGDHDLVASGMPRRARARSAARCGPRPVRRGNRRRRCRSASRPRPARRRAPAGRPPPAGGPGWRGACRRTPPPARSRHRVPAAGASSQEQGGAKEFEQLVPHIEVDGHGVPRAGNDPGPRRREPLTPRRHVPAPSNGSSRRTRGRTAPEAARPRRGSGPGRRRRSPARPPRPAWRRRARPRCPARPAARRSRRRWHRAEAGASRRCNSGTRPSRPRE